MASMPSAWYVTSAPGVVAVISVSSVVLRYLAELLSLTTTDMSPSLFQALGASLDEGVLKIDWHFKPKGFKP